MEQDKAQEPTETTKRKHNAYEFMEFYAPQVERALSSVYGSDEIKEQSRAAMLRAWNRAAIEVAKETYGAVYTFSGLVSGAGIVLLAYGAVTKYWLAGFAAAAALTAGTCIYRVSDHIKILQTVPEPGVEPTKNDPGNAEVHERAGKMLPEVLKEMKENPVRRSPIQASEAPKSTCAPL